MPSGPHQGVSNAKATKATKAAKNRTDALQTLFPNLRDGDGPKSPYLPPCNTPRGDDEGKNEGDQFGPFRQSRSISNSSPSTPVDGGKERANSVETMRRRSSVVPPKAKDRWDVLHPHSKIRYYWDMLTLLLMVWVVLDVPFVTAFDVRDEPGVWGWHRIVSTGVDLFFMADVVLNFNTGVEVCGKVSLSRKVIAKDYLKTWFWVDIVSAFPLEYILNGGVDTESKDDSASNASQLVKVSKIGRVLRMFKLIRLLRVARVLRVISRLEYTMSTQEAMRTLWKFFAVVLVCSHLFTCLFYAIGATYNGPVEWANGIDETVDTVFAKYVAGFYWAIMTITTIGYGDVSCAGNEQRVFGMVAMIIGALLFGYGVSNVVNIVEELRASERVFREKMDKFNSYMRGQNIPTLLQDNIRDYLKNVKRVQDERISVDEEIALLGQLSLTLREDVALAVNEKYVKEMPFFKNEDPTAVMELAFCMERCYLGPGETIIECGEPGSEMYFMLEGYVRLLIPISGGTSKEVAEFGPGEFFGEMALMQPDHERTATVESITFCELRCLSSETFNVIVARYPDFETSIRKVMTVRQKEHAEVVATEGLKKKNDGRQSKLEGDEDVEEEEEEEGTAKNRIHFQFEGHSINEDIDEEQSSGDGEEGGESRERATSDLRDWKPATVTFAADTAAGGRSRGDAAAAAAAANPVEQDVSGPAARFRSSLDRPAQAAVPQARPGFLTALARQRLPPDDGGGSIPLPTAQARLASSRVVRRQNSFMNKSVNQPLAVANATLSAPLKERFFGRSSSAAGRSSIDTSSSSSANSFGGAGNSSSSSRTAALLDLRRWSDIQDTSTGANSSGTHSPPRRSSSSTMASSPGGGIAGGGVDGVGGGGGGGSRQRSNDEAVREAARLLALEQQQRQEKRREEQMSSMLAMLQEIVQNQNAFKEQLKGLSSQVNELKATRDVKGNQQAASNNQAGSELSPRFLADASKPKAVAFAPAASELNRRLNSSPPRPSSNSRGSSSTSRVGGGGVSTKGLKGLKAPPPQTTAKAEVLGASI